MAVEEVLSYNSNGFGDGYNTSENTGIDDKTEARSCFILASKVFKSIT